MPTIAKPRVPRASAAADPDDSLSQGSAAVVAGTSILVLAVLAGFGMFVAVEGLVTPGDAARTAADVRASEGLFRAGLASLFAVVVLDVVAGVVLYRVLAPVSRTVSATAAAFRVAYAGVLLVAVAQLLGVVRLLGTPGVPDAEGRALLAFESFNDTWLLGLGLFGIHLALLGVLAHRSGYVPRLVAVLLVVAGAGYVADTFGRIATDSWGDVAGVTFVGEAVFAVWLLVRGRRAGAPAVIDVTA